jgi:hypothetical protein
MEERIERAPVKGVLGVVGVNMEDEAEEGEDGGDGDASRRDRCCAVVGLRCARRDVGLALDPRRGGDEGGTVSTYDE